MTDVRPFVLAYLEAIGATVRGLPTTALEVRWPPTHVGTFGPKTTLAFDRAVADVARADLCVPGSALLDRIVGDASGRGFHCIARVDPSGEPPAGDVVAANLTFDNAVPEVTAAERGVVPYVLFNFRVALVTDEKREVVRSVMLNAETFEEHAVADVFLRDSLAIPEEPIVAGADLKRAYRAACRALDRAIRPDADALRARGETVLAEEVRRIDEFYEASIRELYPGRGRAPLAAERVLRAERARRVEDAKRKYALTATARLVNARTILIPTTTLRLRVANARAAREVDLEYDAVNLQTNRLACESCGSTTVDVYLCDRRHLVCDACDRGCAFCDAVVCATCAPEALARCGTCVRTVCGDHAFPDAIGPGAYCPDHIHACAICGRTVGPPYVRACDLCSQSYCALCVRPPTERCTTCTSLVAVPATHGDVARVSAAKGGPRKVSRWWRGRNGRYTIVVGRGAVFQHLFVFDRDGREVRRRRGIGLLRA